jgi:hypothetical protein
MSTLPSAYELLCDSCIKDIVYNLVGSPVRLAALTICDQVMAEHQAIFIKKDIKKGLVFFQEFIGIIAYPPSKTSLTGQKWMGNKLANTLSHPNKKLKKNTKIHNLQLLTGIKMTKLQGLITKAILLTVTIRVHLHNLPCVVSIQVGNAIKTGPIITEHIFLFTG